MTNSEFIVIDKGMCIFNISKVIVVFSIASTHLSSLCMSPDIICCRLHIGLSDLPCNKLFVMSMAAPCLLGQ